jgi:hypothetical protein
MAVRLITGNAMISTDMTWMLRCQVWGETWRSLETSQGTVIAGLAQPYRATGNRHLLAEAEKIASAAIAYLAPYGCSPTSASRRTATGTSSHSREFSSGT